MLPRGGAKTGVGARTAPQSVTEPYFFWIRTPSCAFSKLCAWSTCAISSALRAFDLLRLFYLAMDARKLLPATKGAIFAFGSTLAEPHTHFPAPNRILHAQNALMMDHIRCVMLHIAAATGEARQEAQETTKMLRLQLVAPSSFLASFKGHFTRSLRGRSWFKCVFIALTFKWRL